MFIGVATAAPTNSVPLDPLTLEGKLQAIVIPEVEFRQANALDVLDFLGRTIAPDAELETPQLSAIPMNKVPRPSSALLLPPDDPELRGLPTLTFTMHYVSALDVLKRMAKEMQLSLTFTPTNLVVRTKSGRMVMNKCVEQSAAPLPSAPVGPSDGAR